MDHYRTDPKFIDIRHMCDERKRLSNKESGFNYEMFINQLELLLNKAAVAADLFGMEQREFEGYIKYYREIVEREIRRNSAKKNKQLTNVLIDDHHYTQSYWACYSRYLKEVKDFSDTSIQQIRDTAKKILEHKSHDNDYQTDDVVKGLVIGYVQSGKTSHYAGLMSMAVDNGYNLVIILAGVMRNLRDQTYDRLKRELSLESKRPWNFLRPNSLHYDKHTSRELDKKIPTVAVVLKNKTKLKKLKEWLDFQVTQAVNTELKVLLIDDECDQAGINTQANRQDTDGNKKLTRVHAALMDVIHHNPQSANLNETKLHFSESEVKIKHTTYVGYTATPYATVLSEGPGQEAQRNRSLFPKDFIVALEKPNTYWSPQLLFGHSYDDDYRHPCIQTFEEDELESWLAKESDMPSTLKDALHWFICCVAVMRSWKKSNAISMLVNASRLISRNNHIGNRISDYFKSDISLDEIKDLYLEQSAQLDVDQFTSYWPNYGKQESIKELPSWETILPFVSELVDGDHGHIEINPESNSNIFKERQGLYFAIDSSKPNQVWESDNDVNVRLQYPTKKELENLTSCQGFIVVGGNTLSRGLTIEGLVSSWFARTTSTVDTLMQMGRWFGYRIGYELLPRLWLHKDTAESFKHSAITEYNLHEDILERGDENIINPFGVTPWVRLSRHAKLKPTARNRMVSADNRVTFSGSAPQTLRLDVREESLRKNWATFKDFMNHLNSEESDHLDRSPLAQQTANLLWRDIPWSKVKSEFLNKMILPKSFGKRSINQQSIKLICDWVDKFPSDWGYKNRWIVCCVGTKNGTLVSFNENEDLSIRTVKRQRQVPSDYSEAHPMYSDPNHPQYNKELHDSFQFKAIRLPEDLIVDQNEQLKESLSKNQRLSYEQSIEYRKKHIYQEEDPPPILLIYPIDKKVETRKSTSPESVSTHKLIGFNLGEDKEYHLLAFSIVFPSVKGSANENTYSIKLD
jgi:hypothetical protein